MKRGLLLTAGTAALTIGGVGALLGQYPGRIQTQKKAQTSSLRSIAVLEWTGDRSRPNATRLVPVSLFDGNRLQDGALYLARPVPLALDSGTEYEVESAGVPQGWFDVNGARQIGSDWFGFGSWKPYVPPAPKKLRPSKNPPTVVRDKRDDEDRPHFVRRDQSGSAGAGSGGATAHDKAPAPSAPVDPDRPRLRRRPDEDKPAEQATASPAETPSTTPDADRPRIAHGKPANLKDEPKPLEVTPVAIGQTVAVSDADAAGAQTFAFEWGSPADAASAQKELEAQAAALLASTPGETKPGGTASQTSAPAAAATPAKPAARSSARTKARRTVTKSSAKPAATTSPSPLSDVRFGAYALTYGSGATLVLTARETGSTRSIAMIAIEDIYGKVQVLWHSITDDEHLDVTPRVTLVDAVDPRGDGRANLLFEQRNTTDRRFVLYAVGANIAQQVFATDPLPLHPVAQTASD